MIENRAKRWLARALYYIGGAIVMALMFVGAIPLLKQIFYWLKDGVWRSEPIRASLEYIGVLDPDKLIFEEWVGLSRIAEWFLDIHIALVCIPLAVFLSIYGDILEDTWFEIDQEGETNG